MIFIPACFGLIINYSFKQVGLSLGNVSFCLGFFVMLAEFALICYPAIALDIPFNTLSYIYLVLIVLQCVLILLYFAKKKPSQQGHPRFSSTMFPVLHSFFRSPLFWVALCICAFQIIRLIIGEPWEPRDSKTYNALVNDIVSSNHLFRTSPLTGADLPSPLDLKLKYIFSPWYPFMAFLSFIGNTHSLLITNTFMPAYVLFLHYLILFALGQRLLKNNYNNSFLFVIIIAFLREFTITFSTPSIIEMVWPAWGKGAFVALIIPSLLLIYLYYMDIKTEKRHFLSLVLLTAIVIAGCSMSTMSIILIPMELGLLGLSWAIIQRRLWPILSCLISCVPSFAYTILYILLR